MKKTILLDLTSEENIYETYNKTKISYNLISYLLKECMNNAHINEIEIVINNLTENKIDVVNLIKNGLEDEFIKQSINQRKRNILQVIYLIMGMLALFISTLINGEILKEILIIWGWVLIWSMIESKIFKDSEGRKIKRILKRLINSSFIIKN